MPEKGLDKGTNPGLHDGFGGPQKGTRLGLSNVLMNVYQPETIAWVRQLATPLPSAFFLFEINKLIMGLKRASIWKQLDRLWIFASDVQSHARVSLVNPNGINTAWPSNITEENSPTWTKFNGYKGNGSNMYLNTNYNGSTQGINFSLNSGSFGCYRTTSATPATTYVDMGAYDGNITFLSMSNSGYIGQEGTTNVTNGFDYDVATNNFSNGLWVDSRSGPSTSTLYLNGVIQTLTTTVSSSAIPNFPWYILALNEDGSPLQYTANSYSMAFIGSGNINQALLYFYINRFMQKVFVPPAA